MTNTIKATALAIFFVFLWASAYVPSKIAATESDPLWFLAARFLAGGLVLAALTAALRRPFPSSMRVLGIAALLGVLANAGYLGLTYLALRHLASGMGAIVASTNPLVLALVAPYLLRERLSPAKAIGLVLGFGGVVVLVLARSGTGTAAPSDVLLAFLGVCCSVASTIVFKRYVASVNLMAVSAVQLIAAGVVMIPLAAVSGGTPHARLTPELLASFVYLVLVLSVGATLIWFWLLGRGEASRVSAYYYLTPAFGLALSALLLHESASVRDLPGLAGIAAGIAIVQRSKSASTRLG